MWPCPRTVAVTTIGASARRPSGSAKGPLTTTPRYRASIRDTPNPHQGLPWQGFEVFLGEQHCDSPVIAGWCVEHCPANTALVLRRFLPLAARSSNLFLDRD